MLSPVNGVSPDATSIIPDVTLYTWGAPTVTGGITGGSVGVDEAFFDTGVLENQLRIFKRPCLPLRLITMCHPI